MQYYEIRIRYLEVKRYAGRSFYFGERIEHEEERLASPIYCLKEAALVAEELSHSYPTQKIVLCICDADDDNSVKIASYKNGKELPLN